MSSFHCINNVLVSDNWKVSIAVAVRQLEQLTRSNKMQMPACQGTFLETVE